MNLSIKSAFAFLWNSEEKRAENLRVTLWGIAMLAAIGVTAALGGSTIQAAGASAVANAIATACSSVYDLRDNMRRQGLAGLALAGVVALAGCLALVFG
jgi:hypothetical protein